MPGSNLSNQDSAGTNKTAERVFPARTLVVKSPVTDTENPFNNLYGLRKHPASKGSTPQTQQDIPRSAPADILKETRPIETDDEIPDESEPEDKSVATTTVKANDEPDHPIEQFTQEDRTRDDVETVKVMDDSSTAARESSVDDEFLTQRFTYKMSEDGSHLVSSGLGASGVQSCEDEPIHTPGAVQGFGVLITIRESSPKKYQVCHVSENSTEVLGLSPKYLFALDSFLDILPEYDQTTLMDQLEFLEESNSSDFGINAENTSSLDAEANVSPEVFLLSGHQEDKEADLWKCWTALHSSLANQSLIVLEFELQKDPKNPLKREQPVHESKPESTPDQEPERGLSAAEKSGMDGEGFDAFSEEDLLESTVSISRPLRRVRRSVLSGDENGTMEIFSILSQVNEQLSAAHDLETFLKIVVGIVKDITQFHRVMLYQFDDQWNGQVVAELVDWHKTKDLFRGLFFPATDIPAQARALYNLNKVRVLYDRDQTTARLVCRSRAELERPLDMTHSFLRAMSPIHLKYLANMGVRASMSISITAFGQLWGLIACHTYGDTSMRCSFLVRKLCRLMGEQISHNIERLSYAARLTSRRIIQTPTERNPSGYIVSKAEDLLGLFDADIGMLSIGDEGKILGPMENSQEAIALREYFREKRFEVITPSNDLKADFPDLQYAPGFKTVAGVMYIPLSRSGQDFLLFFRRGQLRKVHWAGNPYEKVLEKNKGKSSILLPRQSFKVWSESVVGRCKDWSEDHVETAAVLCLVYGKFIEVWREKQQAVQTSKLASLLLNNAGHEVRTPLNAVINYLEIALEGDLDPTTRESLEKSHTASKSLVYVINDLLDLTKTEQGQDLFRSETFDLLSTVREAVSIYQGEASRTQVEFLLHEDPKIPRMVIGDQAKIRQVIGNVTANALKYTSKGSVIVETKLEDSTVEFCDVSISIKDTGCGISEERLDAIFSNFELVEAATMPESNPAGSESTMMGTGLGLAIVARVVRNMNGQLKAESKVGRGSTFTFNFHFTLPQDRLRSSGGSVGSHNSSVSTRKKSTEPEQKQRLPASSQNGTFHTRRGSTDIEAFSNHDTASQTSEVEKDPVSGERSWPTEAEHQRAKDNAGLQRRHSAESTASLREQLKEVQLSRSVQSSGDSNLEQLVSSMIASPVPSRDGSGNNDSKSTHFNTRARASSSSASGSARSRVTDSKTIEGLLTSSDHSDTAGNPYGTSQTSTGKPENDQHRSLHDDRRSDQQYDGSLQTLQEEDSGDVRGGAGSPSETVVNTRANRNIRALKMEPDQVSVPQRYNQGASRLAPSRLAPNRKRVGFMNRSDSNDSTETRKPTAQPLRVLVAEDDAINRSILQRRLMIDKHEIKLVNDGSDCYDEYAKATKRYDVILMDMQMPVLDGMGASRKIRLLEETCYAERKRRIPIIAVSASLVESQARQAIDAGIDGWILKPVDFNRLRTFFAGLEDNEMRKSELYVPGEHKAWEAGGWLRLIEEESDHNEVKE